MIIKLLSMLLCCYITSTTAAVDETLKLMFVQILYRHGDRAPVKLYPNDPNPASAFPLGLGALTMLGRKQHFGLGKFFQTNYKDFKTSNPLEINVVSSDCDRCLDSAATNLASFYVPEGQWKFEDSLSWQPFHVRYIPKNEDRYLETDSNCTRAEEEEKYLINSPEGQAFIEKHKAMFNYLTINSGDNITEWTSASNLFDVLWIERYNLTIPKWADLWWDELKEVADLSFKWQFNSPVLHRLRAGPLLQRIIKNMQNKINGDTPELKFQVYSAHSTNLAVVLDSLSLFNNKMPPYCATILFELYSGEEDSYFLRLLYLNSTEPEKIIQTPHILVIDGCSEFCPLEYFINYTQHLMPDDWEEECVSQYAERSSMILCSMGILLVLIVTLNQCRLIYLHRKSKRKEYSELMPTDKSV